MPDYSNTTGRTYTNASGSVRHNNNILVVRKVKPAKTSRDTQHVYPFGQSAPAAFVEGREVIEAMTCAVGLKDWELFISANPTWKKDVVQVAVSWHEDVLGAFTFNHKQAKIISEEPSEGDGSQTAEPMVDLSILPLGVEHNGKTGRA